MDLAPDIFPLGSNPLAAGGPEAWERLFELIAPANLLVVIRERMSLALQGLMAPEDVLQEVLYQAWKDRGRFQWQGLKAFRAWILSIATHRLCDLADHAGSASRTGVKPVVSFEWRNQGSESGSEPPIPALVSTTPSRVAMLREQSAAIRSALDSLPAHLRQVLYLRVFEGLSLPEVATRMEASLSAVKHWSREAAQLFRQRTRAATESGSAAVPVQRF